MTIEIETSREMHTVTCTCGIDQDRYIGDDPVGHSCCNPAKYEARDADKNVEIFLCESCKKMLEDEPERITINAQPIGTQDKIIRDLLLQAAIRKIEEITR